MPNECDIDEKCDIWSLGCTAYCLAFGNSPFESPKEGVLKLAILNGRFSIPAKNANIHGVVFSSGFVGLIQAMLQVTPFSAVMNPLIFYICVNFSFILATDLTLRTL